MVVRPRIRDAHEELNARMLAGAVLDPQLAPEAMLAQGVEANVRWSMRQILESPEGRERQAEGSMKLIGAIYEIETGRIRFLA